MMKEGPNRLRRSRLAQIGAHGGLALEALGLQGLGVGPLDRNAVSAGKRLDPLLVLLGAFLQGRLRNGIDAVHVSKEMHDVLRPRQQREIALDDDPVETVVRDELYGLTTQLRRSSSSIAANLAEGCGRNGDAELARFCSIAMGSASELDYHLLLASDLKLINATDYTDLARQTSDVKRMLTGFQQKLTADR